MPEGAQPAGDIVHDLLEVTVEAGALVEVEAAHVVILFEPVPCGTCRFPLHGSGYAFANRILLTRESARFDARLSNRYLEPRR